MKNGIKQGIKISVFIILLILFLMVLGKIFVPKWNGIWPSTNIIKDFYELEDDSVDVLALGTSQIQKFFSSMEMYKDYKYSAYNLGLEGQLMVNSYFLLNEALKTQSPKVVVLDIQLLFWNSITEEMNRKSIDNMKLSLNKLEAAIENSKLEKNENIMDATLSYIFPIFRYHTRWNEITEEDFKTTYISDNYYRGYYITNNQLDEEFAEGIKKRLELEQNTTKKEELEIKVSFDYLNKIIEKCKEKNIHLILVKAPTGYWDKNLNEKIINITKDNQIDYIDFNLPEIQAEIGYDKFIDLELNGEHINVYGASKITNYIGKYISKKYNISKSKINLDSELNKYEQRKLELEEPSIKRDELIKWIDECYGIDIRREVEWKF